MKYVQMLSLALSMLVFGCSGGPGDQPETGRVSGTVTLDGAPIAGVLVSFVPQEGRPSRATTDESGKYQLEYNSTTLGAKLGDHSVRISSAANSDEEEPVEKFPESVVDGSALTAKVTEGDNEIDFKLNSDDY
jgi:hypothetical protein